jgi:F-type H+-transporting ATPase subunit epsilon
MSQSEKQTFHFELVSPEEKLLSEPAFMVVVPGEEGEFGVLANHSALVSSVRAGVIEIHGVNDNDDVRRVFVAGGFADVSADRCVVLAEYAINVSDLTQDNIQSELNNLIEDLGMAENDSDTKRVEAKIEIAKAKMAAVTGEY